MKPHRSALQFGAVLLALSLMIALPALAANKAPAPKAGKTVPSTGQTGTPSSGGSGSTIQKQPPHSNQGPLNLPPY
jgi:hypothetical protein